MRFPIFLLFVIISFLSLGHLNDNKIRNLKSEVKKDSSYVYWLPYNNGNKYLLIQGANGLFSHKGELSFDFKMKTGSKICASRAGIVIATKSDGNKGGNNIKFRVDGNHIKIKHEDGSVAMYWHLKQNGVLVKIGELVQKGQIIGYSGNTGISAFPHLHFQLIDATGKEILPRFQTKKGIIYLKAGRWYKSVNY